jgi:hypothetical protein
MTNLSTTETQLSPSKALEHFVLLAMNEHAHRRHSEATKAGIRASKERKARREASRCATTAKTKLTARKARAV